MPTPSPRSRRVVAPLATPQPAPRRPNHGWGKLVGATVLGIAGALTLQIAGAITGVVLGFALGHLLDLASSHDDLQPQAKPLHAEDLAREAAEALAAEVAEAFAALDRELGVAGRPRASAALMDFLRQELAVSRVPTGGGPVQPWQQDLTSACQRLAPRLEPSQTQALVRALYRRARELGVAAGSARLTLRDGCAALGVSEAEEAELREAEGML